MVQLTDVDLRFSIVNALGQCLAHLIFCQLTAAYRSVTSDS